MNKYIVLVFLSIGLVFTSCVPTKDLIYLQTKDKADGNTTINQVVSKPYRLQTADILTITIKANDPKLVEIFSPRTQTTEPVKNETGLYYDGYTIDDHGKIRMPILGEVEVLGKTTDEMRQIIEKRLLEEYFNDGANIFVTVKLAGLRYTINGEIVNPGSKTLYVEKVNILEFDNY